MSRAGGVTLPGESTLASVPLRKKVTPLPLARAGRTCSDRLALTESTRLSEPRSLYGEKLARLSRRVTLPSKEGDPFRRVPLLVSHVNGSSS